jgi:hypothetical protein
MHRVLAIVICAAVPGSAWAQDDFSRLKVKLGQIVYVTDTATGVEVSGPMRTLSSTLLTIDGYTFQPRADLIIERRGDPLWDGAAIGFGLGAFVFFPVVHETGQASSFRPVNGCIWAAVGALIDYAHAGRTTVYNRSRTAAFSRHIRPIVAAHTKGIVFTTRSR